MQVHFNMKKPKKEQEKWQCVLVRYASIQLMWRVKSIFFNLLSTLREFQGEIRNLSGCCPEMKNLVN